MADTLAAISIREAESADWPAILACQRKMEERMGIPVGTLDLPELEIVGDDGKLKRNSAVYYWVVERDGQVVEAFYLEICLEWNLVGADPEALHAIRDFREQVFALAAKAGARFLHAFVIPGPWQEANGRHLERTGFDPTGFIHYHRII